MLGNLSIVAAGGAIGAVLRYLVGIGALRMLGPGFPVGTLGVNVVGSFAMGICAAFLVGRMDPRLGLFAMTGILGGFTTFSAFSLDAISLWEKGATGAAIGYVLISVVLSVGALLAGLALARGWLA